jgi:hypothetical protein
MPPAGFESEITASKRPQTYDLDYAATGIGRMFPQQLKLFVAVMDTNFSLSEVRIGFLYIICKNVSLQSVV